MVAVAPPIVNDAPGIGEGRRDKREQPRDALGQVAPDGFAKRAA